VQEPAAQTGPGFEIDFAVDRIGRIRSVKDSPGTTNAKTLPQRMSHGRVPGDWIAKL
jgi:hypothetical protein